MYSGILRLNWLFFMINNYRRHINFARNERVFKIITIPYPDFLFRFGYVRMYGYYNMIIIIINTLNYTIIL